MIEENEFERLPESMVRDLVRAAPSMTAFGRRLNKLDRDSLLALAVKLTRENQGKDAEISRLRRNQFLPFLR